MVGLVGRHVHCVADEFSIRTDTVNSDAGLGGPGVGWSQRKGGGILGSSSHHLSSGANLRGQQLLAFYGKLEYLWYNKQWH